MKNTALALAVLAVAPSLLLAQGERTTVRTLHFLMSPSKEAPAVKTTAMGSGQIEITARRDADNNILSAYVDFRIDGYLGQAENFTGLHIHRGAEGVSGPVVINSGLRGPVAAAAGNTSVFYQVEVTDPAQLAILAAIMANPAGYYANIHSQNNPGGIMRGQLGDGPASAASISSLNTRLDATDKALGALQSAVDATSALLRSVAFRLGIAVQ
ncbi:MAG: CHRD domain-containing protein [Bryobacteraceae bacterium]